MPRTNDSSSCLDWAAALRRSWRSVIRSRCRYALEAFESAGLSTIKGRDAVKLDAARHADAARARQGAV